MLSVGVLRRSHVTTEHHLVLLGSDLLLGEQLLHAGTTLRQMNCELVGILTGAPAEHLHH